MSQVEDSHLTQRDTIPALVMLVFGLYLIAGGYYGFAHAKWPWFMPPQLDMIGLLLGLFGERLSGYVGGGVLCLFGLACSAAGLFGLVRNDV